MSIVYDYLKQIKDKKEPAQDAPVATPKPPQKRSLRWLILPGIIVAGGVIFAVSSWGSRSVKPVMHFYQAPVVDASSVPMMRSAEAAYVLEGIIYNPAQPFAIINGKMLEVKDKVGAFEVVKITADSVTLKNTTDQTVRELRL